MSQLVWSLTKPKLNHIENSLLKAVFRQRFGNPINRTVLNKLDFPYLKDLEERGINGAQQLISAIREYGEIQIMEIFE